VCVCVCGVCVVCVCVCGCVCVWVCVYGCVCVVCLPCAISQAKATSSTFFQPALHRHPILCKRSYQIIIK